MTKYSFRFIFSDEFSLDIARTSSSCFFVFFDDAVLTETPLMKLESLLPRPRAALQLNSCSGNDIVRTGKSCKWLQVRRDEGRRKGNQKEGKGGRSGKELVVHVAEVGPGCMRVPRGDFFCCLGWNKNLRNLAGTWHLAVGS